MIVTINLKRISVNIIRFNFEEEVKQNEHGVER